MAILPEVTEPVKKVKLIFNILLGVIQISCFMDSNSYTYIFNMFINTSLWYI